MRCSRDLSRLATACRVRGRLAMGRALPCASTRVSFTTAIATWRTQVLARLRSAGSAALAILGRKSRRQVKSMGLERSQRGNPIPGDAEYLEAEHEAINWKRLAVRCMACPVCRTTGPSASRRRQEGCFTADAMQSRQSMACPVGAGSKVVQRATVKYTCQASACCIITRHSMQICVQLPCLMKMQPHVAQHCNASTTRGDEGEHGARSTQCHAEAEIPAYLAGDMPTLDPTP